jgi:hypothetical protein
MVRNLFFYLVAFLFIQNTFSQNGNDLLRGPQNTLPDGVIDGVVVKDEVPVRSRVEYEHVRLADYVWSKRIFSRIDAREKVNNPLFYPYDEVMLDFKLPINDFELMDNSKWVRHQDRYSLWTIITMHLIKGDLTLFRVNSTEDGVSVIEDGYQLKYPIKRQNKDDFYTNKNGYRNELSRFITTGGKAQSYDIPKTGTSGGELTLEKGYNATFKVWVDSLLSLADSDQEDPNSPDPNDPIYLSSFENLRNIANDAKLGPELEGYWNNTANGGIIMKDAPTAFITSKSINAYNIKEDWFFDKERSMLDKRIIAIAPVGAYAVPIPKPGETVDEGLDRYTTFLMVGQNGSYQMFGDNALEDFIPDPESNNIENRELFWLYFPQLRNVLVNYYVYNNQSDAQWMSFDDFFWKRMFSATIYRSSDQFDRDVEDYRYGVDALYEAEKIKETMRTWETDLWNY